MDKIRNEKSGWENLSVSDFNTISLIYDTNNFTKVGEIMGVDTSLVSYRLKKIEKNLGFTVFERKGKTIAKPTKPGYKLIQLSQDILSIISTNFPNSVLHNNINLSTGEVMALTVLPNIIQRYEVRFNRKIKLEVYNNLSVIKRVISGKSSAGIVSFLKFKEIRDFLPSLYQKKIFADEVIVIFPRESKNEINSPISLADLSNLLQSKVYIGRTFGSGIGGLLENWFKKNDIQFPKQYFSFPNSSSVISAVSRGMGFSMVYRTQVSPLLDTDLIYGCSLSPKLIGNFTMIMLKDLVDQETLKFTKFLEREITSAYKTV